MVDARWPAFEEVFYSFDIERVRTMSDEDLEHLMQDRRLLRHWGKIRTVRENTQAIHELQAEQGSMGQYLAEWELDRIVELWFDLRQHFRQLGGNSGPYFLRMCSKDTFLLTDYVSRALLKWGAHTSMLRGKRALRAVRGVFNDWRAECCLPCARSA